MISASSPRRLELRICPNAVLGTLALVALQFVPLLGTMAALAFLVFATALVARRPGALAGEVLGQPVLCLLIGWCLLSALWSDYPSVSLRHGVQLALTVVFSIVLASRVSPLVLLKCLTICFLVACVVSLGTGRARADGLGYLGIYNSKNAMAAASSILVLAGLCLMVDRRTDAWWRLTGLGGLALGGLLLVRANSVGAIAVTGIVCLTLGLILVLRRVTGTVRLVVGVLGTVAILAAGLIALSWADQIAAGFLDLTGKDLSLTGRTDLWQTALDEIARRPWLGAGYQAVWVQGNPLAEDLWRAFHVESRTGFHFHNAWLSNAVEIGLIGVALQALAVMAAFAGTLAWVMRDLRAETLFLALFMLRQVVLSLVEVPFFFQFDAATVATVAAVVYAAGASARRAPPARPGSSAG